MYVDFPWHFDAGGGTATTSRPDHVRDLLVQFLFTNPGERVNRPDFGAGLYRLCFENNSEQLGDVLQFLVQAGLQRWLADAVEAVDLQVISEEATVRVELVYRLQGEDLPRTVSLTPQGPAP